ncbi:Crp/Fnr family transcriptional regulator [Acetobacter sp. AC2005]|uniref:Crp/Fnr family transcriptional regulator n=1 Tax=Acetobacter sp. AC2005 TaxID=3134142 RepID=UPI0030CCCAF3
MIQNQIIFQKQISSISERDAARLSQMDTQALTTAGNIHHVPPGTRILFQGDVCKNGYVIQSGIVRVSYELADGRRQILGFYSNGNLLGFSGKKTYPYSVDALTDCHLLQFEVRNFQSFLINHPNIQNKFLLNSLCEIQLLQRHLIGAVKFDIISRTVQFIAESCACVQYFDHATHILKLPMNRRDIADYIGISYESLSRAMAVLERKGFIRRLEAGEIYVENSLLQYIYSY